MPAISTFSSCDTNTPRIAAAQRGHPDQTFFCVHSFSLCALRLAFVQVFRKVSTKPAIACITVLPPICACEQTEPAAEIPRFSLFKNLLDRICDNRWSNGTEDALD